MRIKTKLSLGVGFLFALIILLITVSVRYIHALSDDTQNILAANYNTIDYSRQMLIALDEDLAVEKNIKKFQDNLSRQQQNITEPGEKELTGRLSLDFEKIRKNPGDMLLYPAIREDLTNIMLLNMQAIHRKSTVAADTAQSATRMIAATGTFCFLLAFTLLMSFPGSIANPIKELTESIREIAEENYTKRVHFKSSNEFGELAQSFNTMARKLEEYNNSNLAKLMVEKKRIETLINNMHDPVIVLDENKTIIFINEEALKIAGLKHEETIGKTSHDIAVYNELIRSLTQDPVPALSKEKTDKPLSIFADGKESYFSKEMISIDIVPTAGTDAAHIGDVILLKNITPFKELDIAKTNFIATVSHEFKTPISSIKMSLQLLEKEQVGHLNEEQQQLLDSIKEDANRLLKITGELLDITQAESGSMQVTVTAADPKQILLHAVNANKTQAEQKQIAFEISYPENLPAVQADSEKTAWVLINLISNAIHYSPNNSTLFLNITQDNNKMRFSVKDTGPGIAPEYQEKIFDRYFRVPGAKQEGTGLGLAISKELMEAQGGKITVNSAPGTGSTFSIVLNSTAPNLL